MKLSYVEPAEYITDSMKKILEAGERKQKVYDTLYGAIVADALGVPVEFLDREELKKNPVTDMIGYGTYNLPKGSWSDDTSMTLCLAESIDRQGKIDYDDIMKNFTAWYKKNKFTPDGELFDIGGSCRKAIVKYIDGNPPFECGATSEFENGNGSLMRISPLPLFLFYALNFTDLDKEEAFDLIHNISSLTHRHPISFIGCDIYCAVMLEILKGTEKSKLIKKASQKIQTYVKNHTEYKDALLKYQRIFVPDFTNLTEPEIKSTGYVVDTLEAALWCFLTTEKYKDCVLKAVNLGSDTDTVACVAGSIAGLYYGDVPAEWIKTIRNKKLVDEIIESFCERIEEVG